jgi:hypothetical protein
MMAIKKDCHMIDELYKLNPDVDLLIEAMKQNKYVLEYKRNLLLRLDTESAMKLVSQIGYSLKYLSLEQRNDKEIVLKAVKDYGPSLLFASIQLQDDRDLVIESIKSNTRCGTSEQVHVSFFLNDMEIVWLKMKYFDCIRNLPKDLNFNFK